MDTQTCSRSPELSEVVAPAPVTRVCKASVFVNLVRSEGFKAFLVELLPDTTGAIYFKSTTFNVEFSFPFVCSCCRD